MKILPDFTTKFINKIAPQTEIKPPKYSNLKSLGQDTVSFSRQKIYEKHELSDEELKELSDFYDDEEIKIIKSRLNLFEGDVELAEISIDYNWDDTDILRYLKNLDILNGDTNTAVRTVNENWSDKNIQFYLSLNDDEKTYARTFTSYSLDEAEENSKKMNISPEAAIISLSHNFSKKETLQCAKRLKLTNNDIEATVLSVRYKWPDEAAKLFSSLNKNLKIRFEDFMQSKKTLSQAHKIMQKYNVSPEAAILTSVENFDEQNAPFLQRKIDFLKGDYSTAVISTHHFWSDENALFYQSLDENLKELTRNFSNEQMDEIHIKMEKFNDKETSILSVKKEWSDESTNFFASLNTEDKKAIKIMDENHIKRVRDLFNKGIDIDCAANAAIREWSDESAKFFNGLDKKSQEKTKRFYDRQIKKLMTNAALYGYDMELAIASVKYNLNFNKINILKKYLSKGLNMDCAIRLVANGIDVCDSKPFEEISFEAQKDLFTNFFSNKDKSVDNTLKTADFSRYEKDGLPLKYPRKDFLSDLENLLANLDDDKKSEIFNKLGITPIKDDEGKIAGYDGFIDLSELNQNGIEKEVLSIAKHFIQENEIITDNKNLNKSLNSLIKGIPEFINLIGKKQHSGHRYSLDIHILETYKNILSDPRYENLSALDKTKIKLMTVFHDFAKPENVKDENHALNSANIANNILKRYNPTKDDALRYDIVNLIFNHHWSEFIEKSELLNAPTVVAAQIGNKQDMLLESIFAQADIDAIGYDIGIKADEKSVSDIIDLTNETKPLAYNTPIVKYSLFPKVTLENGKQIGVLNLKDIDPDTDMGQYGFVPKTRAKDLLLAIHCTNSQAQFDTFKMLQNPIAKTCQSISLVSQKYNPAFKRFAIVLDVQAKDMINATYYDQGSGIEKGNDELVKLITQSIDSEEIPKSIQKDLHLDAKAYSDLVSQIEKYRYLEQIKDNQTFNLIGHSGNIQTFSGKEIKKAITQANQELINKASMLEGEISEYVTTQAKSTGIYYLRFDSIEDIKTCPDLKDFLDEIPENSQVIFGGYDGYIYSKKGDLWKKS